MTKITYLVTVYNEVKTVEKAIKDVLNIKFKNKEIIIIDNGSNDGSKEIIKKFTHIKSVLRKKNLGFGKSVMSGINKSKGKYVFIQYSDLEYDQKRSLDMMKFAEEKKLDVVLGSRLKYSKKDLSLIVNKPSYLATIICTFLINIFYKKNFTDIIGAKLYRTESIKNIKINNFQAGFDFELMSKISKMKLKTAEMSIKYKPRENSSEKKIKFYHMFEALYEIFRVKFFSK